MNAHDIICCVSITSAVQSPSQCNSSSSTTEMQIPVPPPPPAPLPGCVSPELPCLNLIFKRRGCYGLFSLLQKTVHFHLWGHAQWSGLSPLDLIRALQFDKEQVLRTALQGNLSWEGSFQRGPTGGSTRPTSPQSGLRNGLRAALGPAPAPGDPRPRAPGCRCVRSAGALLLSPFFKKSLLALEKEAENVPSRDRSSLGKMSLYIKGTKS